MLGLSLLAVHLAGRVTASVLSEVDLESLVFITTTDRFDCLDSIGNVGEVDKCTALLTQSVDQLNFAILGEILPQTVLCPGLIQVANVYITGSTTTDSKGNRRGESTRVFTPTNLQATVMDHQSLQVAEGIKRCGRCWVDESNEADMLVRDVPNVMKETTTNNVADLFDGSLRVDVPKVHCSVTQVVDSSSRRRDSGSSYGLLSKRIGDHIAVGTVQNMGVSGSDAKVLRSVLLLGLGNVCASVLAIVDAPGSLPLGLLGKLRNSLDGIAN